MKLIKELIKNPEKLGFNNKDTIFSEIAKGKITIRNVIEKQACFSIRYACK